MFSDLQNGIQLPGVSQVGRTPSGIISCLYKIVIMQDQNTQQTATANKLKKLLCNKNKSIQF